jgi:diguanylate cyclase (GGDEF)-like protein
MHGPERSRILLRICTGLGAMLVAFIALGLLAISQIQTMGAATTTIVDRSIPITTAARDIDHQLALEQLVQDNALAFQDLQLRVRYEQAHALLFVDFRVIAAHDASFPAIRRLMTQQIQPTVMALDAQVQVVVTWSQAHIAGLGGKPDPALYIHLCPPPPPPGTPRPTDCVLPPPSLRQGMVPDSPVFARYQDAMRTLYAAVAAMQHTTERTSSRAQSMAIWTIMGCLVVGVLVVGALGFRLVRAILAANARLVTLATRDPLTGQFNQRALVETLERTLSRASRYGTPCAILFLDIDHFKALNDTYGHPAGDAALRAFAGYLAAHVRSVDTVGRWGGEEFMVILPEIDGTAALMAADRLRAAIAAYRFDESYGGHLTCSIGVAGYPDDAGTREELIAAADAALYTAKGQGRNQARRSQAAALHR